MSFLSPEADGYKTTPAAKVRNGVATVAIAPTETVISSHKPRETWKEQPRFKVGQTHGAEGRENKQGLEARLQDPGTARCAAVMRDFVL